MPTLRFQKTIARPARETWEKSIRPAHLIAISSPWLKIVPLHPLPPTYRQGEQIRTRLYLLGMIPWGEHTIDFRLVDGEKFCFETNEYGGAIQFWRHRFRIEETSPRSCLCLDEIEFEAGKMNSFVTLYSSLLYRHRYNRSKKILEAAPDLAPHTPPLSLHD